MPPFSYIFNTLCKNMCLKIKKTLTRHSQIRKLLNAEYKQKPVFFIPLGKMITFVQTHLNR